MAQENLNLMDLSPDQIPPQLKASAYFDFNAHPFEHQALFEQTNSVCQAIRKIDEYAKAWLKENVGKARKAPGIAVHKLADNVEAIVCDKAAIQPASVQGPKDGTATIVVSTGASVVGADLYLDKGDIFVGADTVIEAGAGIKGPTIIGSNCEIRQGAYLRGDCILGNGCTIRGEIKNTVLLDKANFPHPSYLGDSICGYMAHFGNQATTANLGIYEGLRDNDKRKSLKIRLDGKTYDLGTPKMGVCMGDYCQLGCNSTTDPGTFLQPYTISYTLTRITKGFYGPNEVLKNKPIAHGIVERVPLEPL